MLMMSSSKVQNVRRDSDSSVDEVVVEHQGTDEPDDVVQVTQHIITQSDAHGNVRLLAKPGKEDDEVHEGLLSCLKVCCCVFGDVTNQIDYDFNSSQKDARILLGKPLPEYANKKCLVLDLDETLVHSSFQRVPNPDYIIPVDLEGRIHQVYVLRRPGAVEFLQRVGKLFEVIVFTASLSKYADPLLDKLDVDNVIQGRLFRESCTAHDGNYVKDLSLLGRDLAHTIIVDNSPAAYMFQPDNAIGVTSFMGDENDNELAYCLEFLEEEVADADDVRPVLRRYHSFLDEKMSKSQDA